MKTLVTIAGIALLATAACSTHPSYKGTYAIDNDVVTYDETFFKGNPVMTVIKPNGVRVTCSGEYYETLLYDRGREIVPRFTECALFETKRELGPGDRSERAITYSRSEKGDEPFMTAADLLLYEHFHAIQERTAQERKEREEYLADEEKAREFVRRKLAESDAALLR